MADSIDIQRGRDTIARWRMLAERRLNYLVELYESGRWKIYHQESEFLKMVQEARAALKTWETLAPADSLRDKVTEVALAQSEMDQPDGAGRSDPSADRISAKDNLRET
jgi:uncharacterized repeat protein (TIGR03809 family)